MLSILCYLILSYLMLSARREHTSVLEDQLEDGGGACGGASRLECVEDQAAPGAAHERGGPDGDERRAALVRKDSRVLQVLEE